MKEHTYTAEITLYIYFLFDRCGQLYDPEKEEGTMFQVNEKYYVFVYLYFFCVVHYLRRLVS